VERAAEAEVERLTLRCAHYQDTLGYVPRWVKRGMGARWQRLGALEQRVQMLLGIFAAKGVLPLEFKPAHSVGELLVQQLDDLEREAGEKGGIDQVVTAHFARVYKVYLPRSRAAMRAACGIEVSRNQARHPSCCAVSCAPSSPGAPISPVSRAASSSIRQPSSHLLRFMMRTSPSARAPVKRLGLRAFHTLKLFHRHTESMRMGMPDAL
jgi:hypothetical protein